MTTVDRWLSGWITRAIQFTERGLQVDPDDDGFATHRLAVNALHFCAVL